MRRKQSSTSPGAPPWMTTFADLMAVLVVFFVMLYTMSSLEQERYQEVADSLRQVLGPSVMQEDASRVTPDVVDLEGRGPTPEPAQQAPDRLPPAEPEHTETNEILEALRQALADELEEGAVKLGEGEEGVLLRFPEKASFPEGRARLSEPFVPVLERVAAVLTETPGRIRIAGHTDDVPVRGDRFRSNFELSTARAVSVVHVFLDAGIQPERLTPEGHGPTRPLVPNDTPEQRARNRRVDVHVIDNGDPPD